MQPRDQPLPPPDPPDFAGSVDGGAARGFEHDDFEDDQDGEGSYFAEIAGPSSEGEDDASGESYFAPVADPSAEGDGDEGSFFADVVDPSAKEDAEAGSDVAAEADPSSDQGGAGESFFAEVVDPSADEDVEQGSLVAAASSWSAGGAIAALEDDEDSAFSTDAGGSLKEEDDDRHHFWAGLAGLLAGNGAGGDGPEREDQNEAQDPARLVSDESSRETDQVEGLGRALDRTDPPRWQAQVGGPAPLAGPRSAPTEGVEVWRLDNDQLRGLAKDLEQARKRIPDSPESADERALLERTENKLKAEMVARGMLSDPELRLEHMLVERRLNEGHERAGDLEYSIRLKWEILTRFDYSELLAMWDTARDSLAQGDSPRRAVDVQWKGLLERQLMLREGAASEDGTVRAPWIYAEPGQPGALASRPDPPPTRSSISLAQVISDFIDVLPYAGAAKALNEGIWGQNMLTGEELSVLQRVLGAAGGGHEVIGPALSGSSRKSSQVDLDSTVPGTPSSLVGDASANQGPPAGAAGHQGGVDPAVPANAHAGGIATAPPKPPETVSGEVPPPDDGPVWVNKSSNKYHAEESAQGQRVEQDPDRGTHWEKMSREQAESLGFDAAQTGDPLREQALGRERVAAFLRDYVEGGRERMFHAPANPLAIHQEVPLYSKMTVDGKDYYVRSDPRRTLDVVDLTDAGNPKAIEIGTQTPSRKEIERKDNQAAAWEAAREEAQELRREGGDGKVYGDLGNGTFVDLTAAEYIIPPDVRHLLEPPTGGKKP